VLRCSSGLRSAGEAAGVLSYPRFFAERLIRWTLNVRKDVTPRESLRRWLLLFSIDGNQAALHAQSVSDAIVTGRITDEEGAVAPGARIQITGVDTAAVYTAVSNDGIYSIANPPIGPYTLQAVVPGFQTYV
jgi:hypothetical protein